jgi:phosphoadenosine phosphosulfate reductase
MRDGEDNNLISEWNEKYRNTDILNVLTNMCELFSQKVVFSTSFNIEDQVITHFIAKYRLPIDIFTLDTGRMFQEVYSVWNETEKKYGIKIKAYFPNAKDVEEMVNKQGINGFMKV